MDIQFHKKIEHDHWFYRRLGRSSALLKTASVSTFNFHIKLMTELPVTMHMTTTMHLNSLAVHVSAIINPT